MHGRIEGRIIMCRYLAEKISPTRFILGEGPCYHPQTGELSWVDIKRGELWRMQKNGTMSCFQAGQFISAAIPTNQGRFLLLMTTGAYLTDGESLLKRVGAPQNMTINQRFNDAKCDFKGRLFAGTMPLNQAMFYQGGALYRMHADGTFETVVPDATVSNGMAWSPDHTRMYFIDTVCRRVDVFDYDKATGRISDRRTAFAVDGLPDGMTIDSKGNLWVAVWGAGEVRCYDAENGKVLAGVSIPANNVTSCCFGGDDLRTLYITSSAEDEPDNPDAGCVYQALVDVVGTPTQTFMEVET